MPYLLGIDQSTSGTKALVFDEKGNILGREDRQHQQKISQEGWVSHDPEEIWGNTLLAAADVLRQTKIDQNEICAMGISNQRETALVWERETGRPVEDAVVWQCTRGAEICEKLKDKSQLIYRTTGLPLSPYFSAAKIAWILNRIGSKRAGLCAGTVDSYLIYRLTEGASFHTDYSNASRTQLLNLNTLKWDVQMCGLFGIDPRMLPEICDSNSNFGMTDLNGILNHKIPIHGVLGDSHGALYGQGCHKPGTVKATYGTGSSVMMNIGDQPVFSKHGLATSLAWCMDGKATYVLEGNINYTGAVIRWITELGLISNPKESGRIAQCANPEDTTYLIPAFTGMGAPYWDDQAQAAWIGMTRKTGKKELVKAAEESIAYQISDVLSAMKKDTEMNISEVRADGGPSKDSYLMQFQSDILQTPVSVSQMEEFSAVGPVFAAGIAVGVYSKTIFDQIERVRFLSKMDNKDRLKRLQGWKNAVEKVLT